MNVWEGTTNDTNVHALYDVIYNHSNAIYKTMQYIKSVSKATTQYNW
jgi:hypothetical protein